MFKNIVIPVDLSDKQQSIKIVLSTAINFVNAFGCKLHLVHIMPDFGMRAVEDYLPRNWMKDQQGKYNSLFNDLIQKYIPAEVEVDFSIGRGAIYDEVIRYSEQVNADLIMLSAVRPQFKDYMLGPNTSKIVRHSSISVMVIRD
jgi:universal stress protein F